VWYELSKTLAEDESLMAVFPSEKIRHHLRDKEHFQTTSTGDHSTAMDKKNWKDAWEELKIMLESKPWISQRQMVVLLNQIAVNREIDIPYELLSGLRIVVFVVLELLQWFLKDLTRMLWRCHAHILSVLIVSAYLEILSSSAMKYDTGLPSISLLRIMLQLHGTGHVSYVDLHRGFCIELRATCLRIMLQLHGTGHVSHVHLHRGFCIKLRATCLRDGLNMTGLEQGIGIAIAAEVAAGVPIIAGNVRGPDMMMMKRLEVRLLSGFGAQNHLDLHAVLWAGSLPNLMQMDGLRTQSQVVRVKAVTKEVILQGALRSILSPNRDWQFSYEVWFTCEKVDTGIGKTRKDAQQQAAENALCSLANKCVACIISQAETLNKDPDNQPTKMANGFLWETDSDEDGENSSEGIYGQPDNQIAFVLIMSSRRVAPLLRLTKATEVRRSSSLAGQHAIQTRIWYCTSDRASWECRCFLPKLMWGRVALILATHNLESVMIQYKQPFFAFFLDQEVGGYFAKAVTDLKELLTNLTE
ncbi:RNA polymerase II C-terminal domain phosphatase-like protein 2 isoform X2, partial [Tanacetum coccineum]